MQISTPPSPGATSPIGAGASTRPTSDGGASLPVSGAGASGVPASATAPPMPPAPPLPRAPPVPLVPPATAVPPVPPVLMLGTSVLLLLLPQATQPVSASASASVEALTRFILHFLQRATRSSRFGSGCRPLRRNQRRWCNVWCRFLPPTSPASPLRRRMSRKPAGGTARRGHRPCRS